MYLEDEKRKEWGGEKEKEIMKGKGKEEGS
jgi:hypothetical protein